MTTPAKLVQLIEKHGYEACVSMEGVKRKRMIHVVRRVDTTKGLGYHREYIDIPATLPAVLAWLGY